MGYHPEFSQLLNQLLQRQERSASWLADRLGVSPSTVGRWLNDGLRPGKPETVVQIAEVLGATADAHAFLVAAGYARVSPSHTSNSHTVRTDASAIDGVRAPELPLPATQFVGRTAERATLAELIRDASVRLITILGPGGIGKTRLALAVAQQELAAGHFRHGVAFADLTPIQQADELPTAIAKGLGLPLAQSGDQFLPVEQQVVDYLKQRQLLLVLDNAEHLPDGFGLIAGIVQSAPGVTVLVTSRTALRLAGEQIVPLAGLGYRSKAPNLARDGEEDVSPAAHLFLQTARRVRPTYTPSPADSDTINEICELVGGIPLAIELAASWTMIMSATDILDAIRQSLQFLETDLRDVAERHRSMEAVFDATWKHLGESSRQFFARMSVFRGGFTREAAFQVAGADLWQLRTLSASSLISFHAGNGRYEIHELLGQYGTLRLSDTPSLQNAAFAAHSDYYLNLLCQRESALKGRANQSDMQILDDEIDNIVAGWFWAAESRHVEMLGGALDALGLYLEWRGRSETGVNVFRSAAAALRVSRQLPPSALALAWQGSFERALGRTAEAATTLQESHRILDHCQSSGMEVQFEFAFVDLQLGMQETGRDVKAAQAHFQSSLARFDALSEEWYQAKALLGLAHLCLTQGDFEGQWSYVQRALELYRHLENMRGVAAALSMLADIDNYRRQPMGALDLGYEALSSFRMLNDPLGIATCLSRIGLSYINLGDVMNAREAVRESATLFKEVGSRRELVIANAYLCAIELMAGNYRQADAHAHLASALAAELGDQFMVGVALSYLGFTQFCLEQRSDALKTLREAVSVARRTGATMELTRAQALLGLTQWRNGQGQQARAHCAESLRLAVDAGDPWSLLLSIGSSLVILAAGEAPERAISLHSMLMNDPLCATSRWFEDFIGAAVLSSTSNLPIERINAAVAEGSKLSQSDEATRLLKEVIELGWNSLWITDSQPQL